MIDFTWADDLIAEVNAQKVVRMKEIYDNIVNPKRDLEHETAERRRLLGLD